MCATTTAAVAAVYLCRFFSRIRIRCLSQYYLCIGKQYRGDGRERTQKWTQKAAEKKTYNHESTNGSAHENTARIREHEGAQRLLMEKSRGLVVCMS